LELGDLKFTQMKNLFRIAVLLFSITVVAQTSRFDAGYQKGYKEGYVSPQHPLNMILLVAQNL
jgi:hypothetical protein